MGERGRVERLIRKTGEEKPSIWRRMVRLALTDVRVVVGGLDEESLESLEEELLAADFGVAAALRLVDRVEEAARSGRARSPGDLREALREEILAILRPAGEASLHFSAEGPTVHLVAGVNGVGKTTSVAKMAHRFRKEGRSVLVAAADTFRAGAVEQLRVWAERVGAEFVGGQRGGDPAAVAFDALDAARARGIDVVLVDTAGRLHTHGPLMEELRKVDRVIRKRLGGPPHETLLVLDATVGQNARSQVAAFREALELTGLVLAKLDSTARGGIVVALQEEFGLPVKLVGTGEGLDDLAPFDPADFVEGILGRG